MQQDENDLIQVGRISGLYGVKGWVKIYSYTEPRENIIGYSPWLLKINGQWQTVEVERGRQHGKGVVAKLVSYDDRDQVAPLIDADIAIHRTQLPPAKKGEFYWLDLIGLQVVNVQGEVLGKVIKLMPTGANDVLVVQGDGEEILIPYVWEVFILNVDLDQQQITVDWQADYLA